MTVIVLNERNVNGSQISYEALFSPAVCLIRHYKQDKDTLTLKTRTGCRRPELNNTF